MERIRKDFGRITSDNADLGGDQSTLNLERICKDFGRITSDNADLGEGREGRGSIDTQLGSCHFLGGEGGEGMGGEGRGGQSTLNLEVVIS